MGSYLKSLLLIILLELILSSNSTSQVVYWQRLGDFDYVWDVKVNSGRDIFICSQDENGVIRSTNNGLTWQVLSGISTGIYKLAINNSDDIYAATRHGGTIYKSTNNGDTWVNTNAGGGFYRALNISNEGYIYAGTSNGLFVYSYDSGNSWNNISVTDVQLNSIAICSNGQIFLGTEGRSLFTSTDNGATWFQILNQNLPTQINAIAISDSDYIITTNYSGFSISTDFGITWNYRNTLDGAFVESIGIDSVGNIFLGNIDGFFEPEGVYKSGDNGFSWQFMGGPQNPNLIYFSGNKIFLASSFGLYLYDPSYEPYVGNNYWPLNIGNSWQFLFSQITNDLPHYNLSYTIVERDTIINNEQYFYFQSSNLPRRYSESDNKFYIYYNDSDRLFMDFNLFEGQQFVQFTGFNYRTVNVNESDVTEFGMTFHCKGFTYYQPFVMGETQKFGENLGYYSRTGWFEAGTYHSDLISCIMYDSSGTLTYISEHYVPIFSITPILLVNSSDFYIEFNVYHHYSRIVPPFTGVNFIDSVKMFSYYSNGDTIINPSVILASHDDSYANSHYLIDIQLDTLLMKNGFNFYYRFLAKDRALIPESTWSPDTGYYKCEWDFSTAISVNEHKVSYNLNQNFPNPFNPYTTIEYSIAKAGLVEIEIIDLLGRKIKTLVNEFQNSGKYQFTFDASELSSGIYFYRIKSGEFVQTKKMLLLK